MDNMKLSFQLRDDISPVDICVDKLRFSIEGFGELSVPLEVTLTIEPMKLTSEERLVQAFLEEEARKEEESEEPAADPELEQESENRQPVDHDLSEIDYDELISELMRRTEED